MAVKVWVSYANEDQDQLRRLKQDVREAADPSLPIEWLTDESMRAGDELTEWIQAQIAKADVWILLLSPAFAKSNYCLRKELPQIKITAEVRAKGQEGRQRMWPLLLHKHPAEPFLDLIAGRVHIFARDWPILEDPSTVDERWKRVAKTFAEDLRTIAAEGNMIRRTRLADYRPEMLSGAFTPFLGPSCCDLEENYETARPHLRSRLAQLLKALQGDEDKHARNYATSIAVSRGLSADGEMAEEQGELPAGFVEMQVAFARLGAAACAVFGDAFGQKHQGMTDTRSYSVPLDGEDPLVRFLAETLSAALEAAKRVPEQDTCLLTVDAPHPCLGAPGMWRKLEALALCLFGRGVSRATMPQEAEPEAWSSSFTGQPDTGEPLPSCNSITLAHLEWLGDLLWHTLRFDAPLFPSPDDLSFQLSLCACSPHCIARVPLGWAAATAFRNYEACVSLILAHFDDLVVRKRGGERDVSLAGGLAGMLALARLSGVESEAAGDRNSGPRHVVQEQERTRHEGLQPILLSANLDRDVERKLEAKHCPYYVLFPIYYEVGERPSGDFGGKDGPQKPRKSGWMLSAVTRDGERRHYYLDAKAGLDRVVDKLSCDGRSRQRRIAERRLPGPLIVRLRGAPLEQCPRGGPFQQILCTQGARYELTTTTEFSHRILLSCLDFSRELAGLDNLPQMIRDLLDEDRVLCYLGHILDDPDSLLGVQTEVWLKRRSETARADLDSARERRVSVGCCIVGDMRADMLERMGVTALDLALDQVGKEVVATIGADERATTDGVAG